MSLIVRPLDFETLHLAEGAHASPAQGMCVMPTGAEVERFWSFTTVRSNGCIHWTGPIMWKGYGRFFIEGRYVRAHRFSFSLLHEIPLNGQIDHACHNRDALCPGGNTCLHRRCVNPIHLECVSPRENVLRSALTPARLNSQKADCPQGHPYDEANTLIRKGGIRECRACSRAESARYLASHRDAHNARRRARRAARRAA